MNRNAPRLGIDFLEPGKHVLRLCWGSPFESSRLVVSAMSFPPNMHPVVHLNARADPIEHFAVFREQVYKFSVSRARVSPWIAIDDRHAVDLRQRTKQLF